MNEGVGNATILAIIVVFISVVSGYLAYNVNYTKAFRMKNKIISVYERYNGNCFQNENDCKSEIVEYAREIGYSPKSNINCEDERFIPNEAGITSIQTEEVTYIGYCEYKVKVKKTDNAVDECEEKYYYRILTKIDINIPVVSNIFNLRVLNLTGDTKIFTNDVNCSPRP